MIRTDVLTLARTHPGRALLYSVAPVAVAQVLDAFVHGVSVLIPSPFALSLVAFAVIATQYHVAAMRVEKAWSPANDPPLDQAVRAAVVLSRACRLVRVVRADRRGDRAARGRAPQQPTSPHVEHGEGRDHEPHPLTA